MAHQLVLILDFGSQFTQLIARRVREQAVYCEVHPHTLTVDKVRALAPAAIILSGGPSSVYADSAPALDPALLEAGVPVFGMCYGFQAMSRALGGTVARTGAREYGKTTASVTAEESTLFAGQPTSQVVWS